MRVLAYIFIALVIGVSIFSAIRYNQNAFKARNDLNQERFLRMETEEKLSKANLKAASMEAEIEKQKARAQSLERLVEQTNMVNDDFKKRLDQADRLKESLTQQIEELKKAPAL